MQPITYINESPWSWHALTHQLRCSKPGQAWPYASTLPDVVEVDLLDAYAAHEVLHHPATRAALSTDRAGGVSSVITAAGLGADGLPARHRQPLIGVVGHTGADVAGLLRTDEHVRGRCPRE
ncbi:hypothetical protein [Streptomyces sp. IB2014 016-6]|uniref:hypothetical protein n=1 Tax=Streptomyces sp. IB2014 016-6 TaxID=2517818 RepID=UPI0011CAFE9F|nr:hypothetical protein [Streptomyces sp. IB2014 016-6]TXL87702.1 hypothetical protein EW053_22570 [Streptomyces sp. IB2014 016-6]